MTQRPIKFRAWDTIGKRWFYFMPLTPVTMETVVRQEWDGGKTSKEESLDPQWFHDELLAGRLDLTRPQEFTGLHDKNGKEIWEGDVVRHHRGDNVVEWQNEFGAWNMNYGGAVVDQEAGPYDPQDIEVIGNIYENPELINP